MRVHTLVAACVSLVGPLCLPAASAPVAKVRTAAPDQQITWQRAGGPCGGVVFSIETGPDGAVYAASNSGAVFRSTGKCDNWSNMYVPTVNEQAWRTCITPTGAILVEARDHTFRSTDGGRAWSTVIGAKQPGLGRICVLPHGRLLAINGGGQLCRSEDDGCTWQDLKPIIANKQVTGLVIGPEGRVFASVGSEVYASRDSGDNWEKACDGPAESSPVFRLVAGGEDYLLAGTSQALHRSTDKGMTWETVRRTTALYQTDRIARDSRGQLYDAATDGLHRSMDSGKTWTRLQAGSPDGRFYGVAVTGDDTILASNVPDGVLRSSDDGKSWAQANGGLTAIPINGLCVRRDGGIVAAADEGVYVSSGGCTAWDRLVTRQRVQNIIAVAADGDLGLYAGTLSGHILRSSDAGATWTVHEPLVERGSVPSIVAAPNGHLFAAVGGYRNWVAPRDSGVYRSVDKGAHWVLMCEGIAGDVRFLAATPDGRIFAAARAGLFRSTDGGVHWSEVNTGCDWHSPWGLAVSPSGGVYVGAQLQARAAVIASKDGSSGWAGSVIDPSLLTGADALVIDSQERVYVSTRLGIFRSSPGGAEWELVSARPDALGIRTLAIDSAGHLLAGTDKDGVYRSKRPVRE